jgi:hypothetical protein
MGGRDVPHFDAISGVIPGYEEDVRNLEQDYRVARLRRL